MWRLFSNIVPHTVKSHTGKKYSTFNCEIVCSILQYFRWPVLCLSLTFIGSDNLYIHSTTVKLIIQNEPKAMLVGEYGAKNQNTGNEMYKQP